MVTDEDFLEFVRANQHLGYGRMMQIISDEWRSIDSVGALSIGPAYSQLPKSSVFLAYTLTMPKVNTWNGRFTGEDKTFVLVESVGRSKLAQDRADRLIGGYDYDFGDGWAAHIEVTQVDGKESRRLKKISSGFMGYEWMARSIKFYGEILSRDEMKKENV